MLGICKTGSLINLHFISSKESCCSFPHKICLPFLVRSYIGFSNFCNSGQNIRRKFTIPAKLLHPFSLVGGWSFCIASNLSLNGLTQTLVYEDLIIHTLQICSKQLTFLWGYFQAIFNNTFSKSSNFAM